MEPAEFPVVEIADERSELARRALELIVECIGDVQPLEDLLSELEERRLGLPSGGNYHLLALLAPDDDRFRAGPVIGSGSASFEMIRYLTERLPVMVAPRWILNDVQPIAIRDVLAHLFAALGNGPPAVVEIGADRMPFRRTMEVYGEVRGLR